MKPGAVRRQVTFGAADGVTIILGLLVTLALRDPASVWHAALGAGIAELVGMTAGEWLSDSESGFRAAAANGTAACAACLLPAVPFLAWSGLAALAAGLLLVVVVAGAIACLRPERGLAALAQTYGILLAAAVACAGAGLL